MSFTRSVTKMQIRAKHTTNSKQKDPTSILLAQKQCVVSDFCFVTHFCSVDLCYLQMFLSYAPNKNPTSPQFTVFSIGAKLRQPQANFIRMRLSFLSCELK